MIFIIYVIDQKFIELPLRIILVYLHDVKELIKR